MLDAGRAAADYYITHAAAADGIPYWDTGAPGLAALGDWGARAADPFNDHEPVDSSAAAIASQGLLRLARVLTARGEDGAAYEQAGLRTLDTLLNPARRVPGHRPGARRTAAALRLSLAQPLGPRARRRPDPARRVESVGRLPRARGGAVRAAARTGRAVSCIFREPVRPGRFGPGPTLTATGSPPLRPGLHRADGAAWPLRLTIV